MSLLNQCMTGLVASLALLQVAPSHAGPVEDWNSKLCDLTVAARLPPNIGGRIAALVQTAVYETVNAITHRYPASDLKLQPAPGASIDAAVAAANHTLLSKLLPIQQATVDAAYQAALAAIADGSAKTDGIALGKAAAAGVLALRADDAEGVAAAESYRPHTTPGAYVPTVLPAALQWPQRKPWAMTRVDQFRPGPPPDLKSARWAADYNEIKTLGARNSTRRTAEQTEIARFWEATGPAIYFPLARSITVLPGREVTQNARLLALAGQAMDDAYIAVFDAKYHYNFWRPVTAIRNADLDGNDRTERDPTWLPFIDTPMHPEYPCAHCIISASLGAVLQAELGREATPRLSTTSVTAPGVVRSWTRIEDLVDEVANARIYDGVHYRFSTEVGRQMGKRIGEEVVGRSQR